MHSMDYTFMDIEIDYIDMTIHIIDYVDIYIQRHNIHTITIGEKKEAMNVKWGERRCIEEPGGGRNIVVKMQSQK